ncbi:MAG: hypothetical protein HY088_08065 [Ignavibacteriales bacterium]|nr:hypothetical protein [Ignavibacteriales bacterium]
MTTLRTLVYFQIFAVSLCAVPLFAQRFIDPKKGNIIYTKKGIMDGNFVRTIFLNHGEVGLWPDSPSGEWPKGSGHQYLDGVAVIVQAETRDSSGQVIHPLESNYREFIRKDPVSKIPWGWAPLPGYANATQHQPAMSSNPDTWPSTWPDRSADWNGLWNGFFGRGILNADLETYYRMDDAPDKQYAYWPDPADSLRGGLGLQVAVRGFQWSQVLAADVIFWYYEITNIAKQDYTKTVFAQYVDWGIGGTEDSSDDRGLFDKELDIAWAFDGDGIGQPGNWSPVGVAGYAFLESPGIATNGIDDDDDGIFDERRDNEAGIKITGKEAVLNYLNSRYTMSKFLRFYFYASTDDIPAVQQGYLWTGDENANWRGFTDLNGNGRWDEGEPLNDDVGSDGLGPFDVGYPGPDSDGSQGDGRPEQGEPNFGILDKDESDQIGLTGFSIFPVHFYELHNDEQNWEVLTTPLDTMGVHQLNDVNLGMYFSAGARPANGFPGNMFPLRQLQTERFSMALLFGNDRDDLVRRKKTVQQIYNANYRFAKPPEKPHVVAVPGDHKVTLYWDAAAERSYDPFLQEYDFEGYRVYRSTESSFLENLIITDAYGKTTFRKPIVQFDLVNGIKGLHPIDVNGVKFDLGNDTGLKHSYVDTDVQNGQTYYYAVVSYDRGFYTQTTTGKQDGIAPSECTSIIRVDINGNAKPDVNTAIVIPRVPSAGYVSSGVDGTIQHVGAGTGRFEVQVLNPDSIRNGHTYKITFENRSAFQNDPVPYFSFKDETDGRVLITKKQVISSGEETPIADGLIGYVYNDSNVGVITGQTRWVSGSPNTITKVDLDQGSGFTNVNVRYPADFELRFSNQVTDTSTSGLFFGAPPAVPTKFTVRNLTENRRVQFLFYDENSDSSFSAGDRIIIVCGDSLGTNPKPGNYRTTWAIQMFVDTTAGALKLPAGGDVLRIVTTKPFRTGESFQFKMRSQSEDKEKAKFDMDKIAVVPNPYVGAASWEPPNLFRSGRGERRVYFIHLPSRCTIRVFTVSGTLVTTIEHDATVDNGQEPWNLVSKDGMDISYGIYIYHVDAPGVGETIGKFAVIK